MHSCLRDRRAAGECNLSCPRSSRQDINALFTSVLPQVLACVACTTRDSNTDLGHLSHPYPDSLMAAPAPTAPASAAMDMPEAKRQRLATMKVKWTPPTMTHSWTIQGLTVESFVDAASTDEWLGPEFEALGLRWQLFVRPKEVLPEKGVRANCCSVYLRLLDRTAAPVELAEAVLCVGDVEDLKIKKRFYTGDTEHFPLALQCSSACGTFWTHDDLIRDPDFFLAGGQMVISVTLRSRSFEDLVVPTRRAPLLPDLIAAALPSFGSELADGVDVVFKAAGERIEAHSFILALRSSTLRASLWGPLAAANGAPSVLKPRELDIPEGIDTETFRRVLAFMYADAVPELKTPGLPVGQIHALLHAADYLDVSGLHDICVAELHKRLAPENAVATLKIAHALSCMPLLDATLRFTAANLSTVMRTPGWAELSLEPDLMQAVVSTMATGEPPAKVPEPAAGKAVAVSKGKRK